MADKKSSGDERFFSRLLIILYALGIVALGAYPLKKEGVFRSVERGVGEFRRVFAANLPSLPNGWLEERPEKGRVAEPARGEVSTAARGEPTERLDNLTNEDRTKLKKLVDGL